MSLHLAIAVFAFSACLIALSLRRNQHSKSNPTTIISSPHAIRHLLRPPHLTEQEKLLARAHPNKRLVQAFGITNTFVSPSIDVHVSFRNQAHELIRPFSMRSSETWEAFYQTASQIIHTYLEAYGDGRVLVPFDHFIRCTTFCCIVLGLLQVDLKPANIDFENIDFITSSINEMWSLSKTSEGVPPHLKREVHHLLVVLFREDPRFPNPLDFVIPTWETLWRTVAHTLTLATTNNTDGATTSAPGPRASLLAAFADLHRDAGRLFSTARPEEGLPKPESIVLETMRLHPPSRRISRARFPSTPSYLSSLTQFSPSFSRLLRAITTRYPGSPPVIIEKADVWSAQRSEEIWGPTADRFDPFRLEQGRVTQAQKEALLMFGYGGHSCVARKWAPIAVGVMLEAMLDAGVRYVMPPLERQRVPVGADEGRGGWPGWEVFFDRSCHTYFIDE